MSKGGKREGSGRKIKELPVMFRDWCRGLTANPTILANIKQRCLDDPHFALRVFEYGIGRPPQAISLQHRVEQVVRREFVLPDGQVVGAELAPPVPDHGAN